MSEKVDTDDWRDEPLEQLLLLITSEPLQPQMLKFIDLPRLREQLKPAIDVLHFGGKVVGPQDAAVLDASAKLSDNDVQAYAETVTPMFLVARAELARRKP